MIDVTLLGTGGTQLVPGRYLTQLYVRCDGYNILVDCGEATVQAILQSGVPLQVDVICLTHSHGDHTYGLLGLTQTMDLYGRTKELIIVGNDKALEFARRVMQLVKVKYPIKYVSDTLLKFGSLEIRQIPLLHSVRTQGYEFNLRRLPKFQPELAEKNKVPMKYWKRLQQGETVVDEKECQVYIPAMVIERERKGLKVIYATDTRPCNTLLDDSLRDADLLFLEGMYIHSEDADEAKQRRHMTVAEAMKVAAKMKAKRTILTHFSVKVRNPDQSILRFAPTKMEFGTQGMEIHLDFSDD